MNEGVSKQAHPLFLRVIAQTHFLEQYLNLNNYLSDKYSISKKHISLQNDSQIVKSIL